MNLSRAASPVVLLAAALIPAAAYAPLFLARLPRYMDPLLQAYPYHLHLWRTLRAGTLPLWNPHIFAGAPFAANPQAGVFYLPRLVLAALLAPDLSFTLLLALHYVLAAVATWLWLRSLGLGRAPALVGSATYALGGQLAKKLALPPVLLADAWIPLALYAIERGIATRRLGWFGVGGGALAAMCLAGYPQSYVYALVWVPLYAAVRLWPLSAASRADRARRPWAMRARLASRVAATAVLLWLVSGWPAAAGALLPHGLILGGLSLAAAALVAAAWPLALDRRRLTRLLAAITLLVGAAALLPMVQLLSTWSFAQRSSQVGDPSERGVIHSLELPNPEWNEDFWRGQRIDVNQSLFLGVVPIVGLAATLLGLGRARRSVPALVLVAGLGFLVASAEPLALGAFRLLPPLQTFPSVWGVLIFVQLALAGLAAAGLDGLALRLRRRPLLAATVPWAAALVAVAQLWVAPPGDERYQTVADLYPEWWTVKTLKADPAPARFVSLGGDVNPRNFTNPLGHALAVPNLAMVHGLDDVAGYDPLQLLAYKSFVGIAAGDTPVWHPGGDRYHYILPNGPEASPLIDLLGVRHVLTVKRKRWRRPSPLLRDHPEGLPRAWLTSDYAVAADADTAMRWVHGGEIDARRTVVLDAADAGLARWALAAASVSRPEVSVYGSARWLGAYAHVDAARRLGAVGPGLNMVAVNPGTRSLSVAAGDEAGLAAAVARIAAEWPRGTRLAAFSAGGFNGRMRPGGLAALAGIGFDAASIARLEAAPYPIAVAALSRVGAAAGTARVAVSGIVARVDSERPLPSVAPWTQGACVAGSVSLAPRTNPNRIVGSVDAACASALVVGEVQDSGWTALVDGREAPLARAYGLVHALPMAAGKHSFELRYRPRAVVAGALVSLLSLVVVIATSRVRM